LNWVGICALAESLALLEEVGAERVAASAMAAVEQVAGRVQAMGLANAIERDPDRRSAILAFTLGSVEADEACVQAGRSKGILFGRRGYGIRVGAHFWNTPADVDRLIDHLESCQ
jgi:selenocysteine lyase/cysteine desulfurase